MPPHVRLLDPSVINRIAAGEVVERPASVVKELVENSLDAGANTVYVDIEDSGKRSIRVADDGCGMCPEDAELALERHATSKIESERDLRVIRTLGFRGEALPSIASVSRLTLVTRSTEAEYGVRIRVEGGVKSPPQPTAAPVGTVVTVQDLFFNTPARLKFLKSDATELAHIVELIAKYAIVYPEVGFYLRQNGEELLCSPGGGGLLKGIAATWGRETAEQLLPVEYERHGIRVIGYVSPPHLTRHSRAYQHFFVNRRPVQSKTIAAALADAYRTLTPERRYPMAVLGLEVAPEVVDCNVHPSKSEVKFQSEGNAFEAVRGAVRSALLREGMMPEALGPLPSSERKVHHVTTAKPSYLGSQRQPAQSAIPPSHAAVIAAIEAWAPSQIPEGEQSSLVAEPQPRQRFPFSYLLEGLRVVGQAMNTFIIVETALGLAIIDQHVAHERVLYEKLCGLKGKQSVETQTLVSPETIELPRRFASRAQEVLEAVAAAGFELEPFGRNTFLLRAVPAVLAGRDYKGVLTDILDEVSDETSERMAYTPRERVWIATACRMAVKAGDALSHVEMLKLIHDLADTENPYLCPHGRPIAITIRLEELMRKFKRI